MSDDLVDRLRLRSDCDSRDAVTEIVRLTTLNSRLTDKANAYLIENAKLVEHFERLRAELAAERERAIVATKHQQPRPPGEQR